MGYQEIINIIKPLLNKYDIENFDGLKPQTQQQLIMIEQYFQLCIEKYSNIKHRLDDFDLSIRGICKASNIGKSTVYNNPDILKKYIEKRLNEVECNISIISKPKLDALTNKVEQLQSNLDKMLIDIVEFENMRIKISNLEKTITRLETQKQIIAEEKNNYIIKNNELQKELMKKNNKIIHINK